jgi:UDP-3-O-[3-hydroxymyristoyl] glucosamine N-acyltransferase
VVFVDELTETEDGQLVNGRHVKVIRDWNQRHQFIVGIRDPNIKGIMIAKALLADWEPHPTVIHPNATVRSDVGKGGVVCPGAVVCGDTRIGDCVIVGSNAIIGNNTWIGASTTIGPGAYVADECWIGGFVHVGGRSVVCERVRIDYGIKIGPGARVSVK